MRNSLQILILLMAFWGGLVCAVQTTDIPNRIKNRQAKHTDKKIVFIPGNDSHEVGSHEYLGGCRLLAKLLNENVPGVKAIVTEQGWPKDTKVLDDADAIVLYCDGGINHMIIPNLEQMDRLMKKGVGILGLHYGLEITKGESGNFFLEWLGGYFETFYSVNPFWTPRFEKLPRHPMTNGVNPFEATDEWYYHIRFRKDMKNITPILSANPPASTLDRPDGMRSNNEFVRKDIFENKNPQIIAWAYKRPNGGRSVGITGGHTHNNWLIDDYRKLILNAIVWIAKIKVPKNGIETLTPTQSEMDSLLKKPRK